MDQLHSLLLLQLYLPVREMEIALIVEGIADVENVVVVNAVLVVNDEGDDDDDGQW